MHGVVDLSGLTVRFSESITAVDSFSLQLLEREFVSIVGPSGCGKTTVLNVLAGLIETYDGDAFVNGQRPIAGDPQVAYMLARDSLLPWRSALENASYGLEIRGIDETVRKERAAKLLSKVGLAGFEDAWPKTLSQGMRQRVALARTFCLESQLLLMDEPFGALDAQTKIQLEDLLLELWTTEARTVLFVTHDLSEAVALSDRVIVMSPRPGKILAEVRVDLIRPRSVRQLQSDPKFLNLYGTIWKIFEQGVNNTAGSKS